MAGLVDGVLDADQWAFRPAELARIILDQLDGEAVDGLADWVEARWRGPVLLDADTLEGWLREWGRLSPLSCNPG